MRFLFLILLSFIFLNGNTQEISLLKDSTEYLQINNPYFLDKNRKNILLISKVSSYSISLLALNQLWYADYPRSGFHFINDNREWLQMDKIGHMSASFYMGVAGIKAYEWAGFDRRKAIWYGGMTGSFFLTIIEVLDGTSKQWGASSGDLIANTAGSFLAIGQALHWGEQRVQLKYSYMPTSWAIENPEQLGYNHAERALKDYNGQTYWVTFNIKSFFNINRHNFPTWLSLALGYGGEAMTQPYAREEDAFYRQYYVSFDIDLNKIKSKNKIVRSLLHTFGFLKIPMPALEFSNGNIFFHKFYY